MSNTFQKHVLKSTSGVEIRVYTNVVILFLSSMPNRVYCLRLISTLHYDTISEIPEHYPVHNPWTATYINREGDLDSVSYELLCSDLVLVQICICMFLLAV